MRASSALVLPIKVSVQTMSSSGTTTPTSENASSFGSVVATETRIATAHWRTVNRSVSMHMRRTLVGVMFSLLDSVL